MSCLRDGRLEIWEDLEEHPCTSAVYEFVNITAGPEDLEKWLHDFVDEDLFGTAPHMIPDFACMLSSSYSVEVAGGLGRFRPWGFMEEGGKMKSRLLIQRIYLRDLTMWSFLNLLLK